MKVFTYMQCVLLLAGMASCQPQRSVESLPRDHLTRVLVRQAPDFFADSVWGYDKYGSPLDVVRSLNHAVPAGIYTKQDGSVNTLVFHTQSNSGKEFPEPGMLMPYPELRTRLLGKVVVVLHCSDPDLRTRLREACMPFITDSFLQFYDGEKEFPFPKEGSKLIQEQGGDFLLVLGTNGSVVIWDKGDLQGSEGRLIRAVKKELVRLEYTH